ncbi:MAG: ribosome maturation factor RimP [Oscillospiraceae bacterium]
MQIIQAVWDLSKPIVEEMGLILWDVRFEKEGASYFLRIVIDKEGGVDMASCEAVSRRLDPLLDEWDPIESSYCLEVWSAGLERDLLRDFHFTQNIGKPVTIGLFAPLNGDKEPVFTLKEYHGKSIIAEDSDGQDHPFILSELRFVRQKEKIDFGGK